MVNDQVEPVVVERLVGPEAQAQDQDIAPSISLRPQSFASYPGQERAKKNLQVFVEAAKLRKQALDHVILHGPPGLGKTTLARIIAAELGVVFHATTGPALDRPADLAGILASLENFAVLFIDEIHRLPIHIEEMLYSAMEDFQLDVVIGQGPTARTVNVPIAPFTLIGATTKLSKLSSPFLGRFGIQEKLSFYTIEALVKIIRHSAKVLGATLTDEALSVVAGSCRGTPRIANRLLKRVIDFGAVSSLSEIDDRLVVEALNRLGIDSFGLDELDRRLLDTLVTKYGGGPVGIEALAVATGEDRHTIEDVYEPFLIFRGLINRTPRGRVITELGKIRCSTNPV